MDARVVPDDHVARHEVRHEVLAHEPSEGPPPRRRRAEQAAIVAPAAPWAVAIAEALAEHDPVLIDNLDVGRIERDQPLGEGGSFGLHGVGVLECLHEGSSVGLGEPDLGSSGAGFEIERAGLALEADEPFDGGLADLEALGDLCLPVASTAVMSV